MLTADQVHANNHGSHLFEAKGLSIVIRRPLAQEWDLYMDMRRKDRHEARKMLRTHIIFPSKDDVARLIERKPALSQTFDNLIMSLIAPESGKLTESSKHAGAQMIVCDGVEYHLRQPTEAEYEKYTDGLRQGTSTAVTHFVKACLLEPGPIELDQANSTKPGLKHFLAGNLMNMAGDDLEFTEKK